MHEKTVIIAVIALLVVAVVGLNLTAASSQEQVRLATPASVVGEFPIMNGLITPSYTMSMLVDTGSDLSMITPGTLQILKDKGCRVDSSFCPVFFRDNQGEVHFTAKRYTVDLPINPWQVEVSDDGSIYYQRLDTVVNVLQNVNFIPAVDPCDVIGLDLLDQFAVEFNVARGTVIFHKDLPDDFDIICPMGVEARWLNFIGCSKRYYVNMEVSSHTNSFFVDTALDLVQIKMPSADSIYSHSTLERHNIVSAQGRIIPTTLSRAEWVRIGNRSGASSVCYYDDDDDTYAVNPFQFAAQGVLLDFPNNRLCYRRYRK